ncbi:DUF1513 domain-containing protein [Pseudaminobacter sp. 19-2017]|uniref:DUF1513 domain-containing protein n=1 Tax=Pseudaminobacter soli (ex Zhang et al. 2022) TaxID=2831468 RepID=A0A942I1A9_9HYPH|nr:DUF1513 domain-containing protein [Pseudaminobacter soli]
MKVDRRSLLAGGALLGLAAAAPSPASAQPKQTSKTNPAKLKHVAVYVPGYMPEYAYANGKPLDANRRFTRAIKDKDAIKRMITRVGMDGSIRQTLLPVNAHDVEVAPDRSIGVLCGFEGGEHCSFDPDTLEMAAIAPSFREGWRGGGHAVYLDGGKTLVVSERSPKQQANGKLEHLFGRLTIRDPESLRIRESYSTHGVDPHDIRLTEDGKYIVAANYGSVISPKTGEHTVPRTVAEASITVIELSTGKLVDKRKTPTGRTEIRHLAAGAIDRIFAIQSTYGSDREQANQLRGDAAAYDADLTSEPGLNYIGAATLKYDARTRKLSKMGDRHATALMRHGLSIRYDSRHDQVLASYPSSHHLMIFDGATGAVVERIDTRTMGLRYPCGITLLPDGEHYAVTGYWESMFVFERGTHRLVRELCQYPMFFGHSHITSA